MKKTELEELKKKLKEQAKELEETRQYFIAKNQGKIAYIISQTLLIEHPFASATEYCKKLYWLDDETLKIRSTIFEDVYISEKNYVYCNDKKEIYVETAIYDFNDNKPLDTAYFKLDKQKNKLERVYFEGEKSTLGKKIWG